MSDSGENSYSEQPKRQVNVGLGANEEQAGNQEYGNVFKVVKMGASHSLHCFVFLDRAIFVVGDVFWVLERL